MDLRRSLTIISVFVAAYSLTILIDRAHAVVPSVRISYSHEVQPGSAIQVPEVDARGRSSRLGQPSYVLFMPTCASCSARTFKQDAVKEFAKHFSIIGAFRDNEAESTEHYGTLLSYFRLTFFSSQLLDRDINMPYDGPVLCEVDSSWRVLRVFRDQNEWPKLRN